MSDVHLVLSYEKAVLLYKILEPVAAARPLFLDLVLAMSAPAVPPATVAPPQVTTTVKAPEVTPPKKEAKPKKVPEPEALKFEEIKKAPVAQKAEAPKTK